MTSRPTGPTAERPDPPPVPTGIVSLALVECQLTAMWEIFEHTADLGLRIRADSRDQLFSEAAHGLFSLIVQWKSDMPTGLKSAAWCTVAWPLVAFPATVVWAIALGVTEGAARQTGAADVGLVAAFVVFCLCGSLGLFLLGRFRLAAKNGVPA